MHPEGEIWPVLLIARSVVMTSLMLPVTSAGRFDVVSAG